MAHSFVLNRENEGGGRTPLLKIPSCKRWLFIDKMSVSEGNQYRFSFASSHYAHTCRVSRLFLGANCRGNAHLTYPSCRYRRPP